MAHDQQAGRNQKIALLFALASAGTLIGYIMGRSDSPDASKPETARWYLRLYSRWQLIDDRHGELTLRTRYREFKYVSENKDVTDSSLPPDEAIKKQPPKRNFDDDFKALVELAVAAPTETGAIATITGLVRENPREAISTGKRVLLIGLTAGTGIIGYLIGHEDEPDTANSEFEKVLKNDVATWEEWEKALRTIYLHDELATLKVIVSSPDWADLNYDSVRAEVYSQKTQHDKEFHASIYKAHPEIQEQLRDGFQDTLSWLADHKDDPNVQDLRAKLTKH